MFPYIFLSLDLSPASSGSGNFSQLTPDSATSPHAASPSPQPTPKSQKGGEKSTGEVKKAKSRTAFSKEQLQTLHQRFQSQKYLSPQQIRELAATLALTYKQVSIEGIVSKGTCLIFGECYSQGKMSSRHRGGVGDGHRVRGLVLADSTWRSVPQIHPKCVRVPWGGGRSSRRM